MMELYQAYTDYYDMMEIVESLFERLLERFVGSKELEYQIGESTGVKSVCLLCE